MRNALLGMICFCLAGLACVPAGAQGLQFQAPSFETPFYRVQFVLEVKTDRTSVIKRIGLNEEPAVPSALFKDGKNIPMSSPLQKGLYILVLDYAWAGGKEYQAEVCLQREEEGGEEVRHISGVAPEEGGIPGGEEGFYRIYQLAEETGLERHHELVSLTLTAPKSELENQEFLVFDGKIPLPYEILERRESVPPESAAATHPTTSTLKIVLPVDLEGFQKKMLLVLRGRGAPDLKPGFSISGEGLGKTVKGSRLTLEFHPRSGQVNIIEARETRTRLFNKAGVIHWNPDVFVPGIGWDHSFDWNPPAVFEEKAGAYLYLNARRGPLPRVEGVHLEVKYTFPSEAPYFISETQLVFEKDRGVIAVRNDEMVLFRELFESFLYKDGNGDLIKLPLKAKERLPFGLVHTAPADLDWVGLVNERDGFGFFSLRLSAANGNFEVPGDFFHRPGTYFYAPGDGNYVYWVRPLIYTWGDFFSNTQLTFVPKGSFFYEKNAYVILPLGPDLVPRIESLQLKLRKPLRVF
jgi:hypothetical protein